MFELLHYLICLVSVFTDAIVAVYLAMRSNATLEEACLDLFGMYFAFTDTRGAWRLVIRQPKAPKEGELAAAPRKDVASTFYLHLFHMVCKVLDVLIPMYHEVAAIRTPLNGLYISATSIELAWSLLNAGWLLSRIGLTTVYIFLITLRTMLAVLHKGLRLLRSTVRRPSILMKSDQLQSDFFPKLASELRKMVYDNALEPVLNPGKSSPYPCPSGHVCPHHDNTWRIPVPNILLACRKMYHEAYELPTWKLHTKLSDLVGMIQQVTKMRPPQLPWLFIVAPLPPDTRPAFQQIVPSRDMHVPVGYRLMFASIFLIPYLCITPDIYVYWHPAPAWAQPTHHCGRLMQVSGRRIGFGELANNEAGSLEGVLPRREYRERTVIEMHFTGRWFQVRRAWVRWIEDFTGMRTSWGSVWGINDVGDRPFPQCW